VKKGEKATLFSNVLGQVEHQEKMVIDCSISSWMIEMDKKFRQLCFRSEKLSLRCSDFTRDIEMSHN